ncbi:MAG: leucine-rich repeat domain-containing protein [Treponema sp.]
MAAALVTAGCKTEANSGDEPTKEKNPTPTPNPKPSVPNGTMYAKVKFSELETYLQSKAQASKTNYIEVTDLTKEDMKGETTQSGKLGDALKKHSDKKVALKRGSGITDLTDMANCFRGCTNLVSLHEVPEGVTTIKYCFESCTALTEVTVLPSSLTAMDHAFEKCSAFVKAPAIPSNVTEMENCFSQCTSLVTAPTIPQKVESLDNCFVGCKKLTTVPAIPESVKYMRNTFQDCESLTTAPDIPSHVEFLEECFADCKKLKSAHLKCKFDNDYSFHDAFKTDFALEKGGIKVPKDQLETYKSHAAAMGTTADKFSAEN